MGKWISMFFMIVIVTVLLYWGLAGLIGGSDDLFILLVIAIIISLQCSLIITLLIAILEKLPKKK